MADTQITEQQPAVQSTMSAAPKQLTSTDILGKMEAGQPLYQGEVLPNVPKGVPAKSFYSRFPGGASAYTTAFGAPNILDPNYGDTFTSIPASSDTTTNVQETVQPSQEETVIDLGDTSDYTGQDEEDVYAPFADVTSPLDQYAIDFPDYKDIITDIENLDVKVELDNFFTNGINNLTHAIDKGVDSFTKELSSIYTGVEEFIDGPFDFLAKEIQEEIRSIEAIFKNPFSMETVDKVASAVTKTVAQQMLGGLFAKMGFGMVAGPASFILVNMMSGEGGASQIGMPGTTYEVDGQSTDIYDHATATATTIAGYDMFGRAVNERGFPVHVHTPGSQSTGQPPWGYSFESLGAATSYPHLDGLTPAQKQDAIDYFRAEQYSHDYEGDWDVGPNALYDERADFQPIGTRSGTTTEDKDAGIITPEDLKSEIEQRKAMETWYNMKMEDLAKDGDTTPSTPPATEHQEFFDDDPDATLGDKEDPDFDLDQFLLDTQQEVKSNLGVDPLTIEMADEFDRKELEDVLNKTINDSWKADQSEADTLASLKTDEENSKAAVTSLTDKLSQEIAAMPDQGVSTNSSLITLAQMVETETGNQNLAGKVAAAYAALNRDKSSLPEFKNKDLHQILTAQNQFELNFKELGHAKNISKETITAVAYALVNRDNPKATIKNQGGLYFLNPEVTAKAHSYENIFGSIRDYFNKDGTLITKPPPELAVKIDGHWHTKYWSKDDVPEHLQASPEEIRTIRDIEDVTTVPDKGAPDEGIYGDTSLVGDDPAYVDEEKEDTTISGRGNIDPSVYGSHEDWVASLDAQEAAEQAVADAAAAAEQSAIDNMQGVGPGKGYLDFGDDSESGDGGNGGGGEAGDDSGKIICTMMNRMYGLGEYRIKQWLLYSDRHLKEEHQLGYHKLYCNLVAKMPTNRTLAKILSHLADKRTDDIVAEMKGTERSWLGRFYRTTLIDGPSYLIGSMIKNNWLKPADISVLQKT